MHIAEGLDHFIRDYFPLASLFFLPLFFKLQTIVKEYEELWKFFFWRIELCCAVTIYKMAEKKAYLPEFWWENPSTPLNIIYILFSIRQNTKNI